MITKSPVWKILAFVGAVPCYAVYIFALVGMFCGSVFTYGLSSPVYDFTCNVLAILTVLWLPLLILFLLMLCGMAGWVFQVHSTDMKTARFFWLILSLLPMAGTLVAAAVQASHMGITIPEFHAHPLWKNSAIIPWAVTFWAEYWYIHLLPPFFFYLSIKKDKEESK